MDDDLLRLLANDDRLRGLLTWVVVYSPDISFKIVATRCHPINLSIISILGFVAAGFRLRFAFSFDPDLPTFNNRLRFWRSLSNPDLSTLYDRLGLRSPLSANDASLSVGTLTRGQKGGSTVFLFLLVGDSINLASGVAFVVTAGPCC